MIDATETAEAGRLAREIAALTGESEATAIVQVLRERLGRLQQRQRAESAIQTLRQAIDLSHPPSAAEFDALWNETRDTAKA